MKFYLFLLMLATFTWSAITQAMPASAQAGKSSLYRQFVGALNNANLSVAGGLLRAKTNLDGELVDAFLKMNLEVYDVLFEIVPEHSVTILFAGLSGSKGTTEGDKLIATVAEQYASAHADGNGSDMDMGKVLDIYRDVSKKELENFGIEMGFPDLKARLKSEAIEQVESVTAQLVEYGKQLSDEAFNELLESMDKLSKEMKGFFEYPTIYAMFRDSVPSVIELADKLGIQEEEAQKLFDLANVKTKFGKLAYDYAKEKIDDAQFAAGSRELISEYGHLFEEQDLINIKASVYDIEAGEV